MISFEKAQQIVLDNTEVLETVSVALSESKGMVLAERLISEIDIPSFDIAAINGFAVRSSDVNGAAQRKPVTLILDGEIGAGEKWEGIVQSGHAVKVELGVPLPDGTDTIISGEFAVRENAQKVNIYKHNKPGEYIRIRGGEIEEGEPVFPEGKLIGPADIGYLAAIGKNFIKCHRKPRVAFFAAGNDLIAPDQPIEMGKTRAANIFTIQAKLIEYGAEPINLGINKVATDDLKYKIDKAKNADMIIVTAGSSFNDFDTVKQILQQIGMDLKFWKVAMKPGKPFIFGEFDGIPVFGISGNHLSSIIALEEFVRPAIMKMLGMPNIKRTEVVAILQNNVKSSTGITNFIRTEVKLTDDGFLAIPGGNKANSVKSYTSANGFIVVPEDVVLIEAGEKVKVQVISAAIT
jgi:molybdopterin molybdotransferase